MRNKHNSKRAYVGDIIKTKIGYTPTDVNGKKLEPTDDRYQGFIVKVEPNNKYGVRLGSGLPFTHHLNGILRSKNGTILDRDDFEIEEDL